MRGEFWADDLGNLFGADGEIDDSNHESIAVDYITREIFDALDFKLSSVCEDWAGSIEFHKTELCQFLSCEEVSLRSKIKEQIILNLENDSAHSVPNFSNTEILEFALDCVFGFQDPKLYMVQHAGWIRVHGNNIEIWKIDAQTLDILATTIYNIDNKKPHRSERFVLESRGEGICYNNVPYVVIERADLNALQKYKM